MASDLPDVRESLPSLTIVSDVEKLLQDSTPPLSSDREAEIELNLTEDHPDLHLSQQKSNSRDENEPEITPTRHKQWNFEATLALGWVRPATTPPSSYSKSLPNVLEYLSKRSRPSLRLPTPASALAIYNDSIVFGLYDGTIAISSLLSSLPAQLFTSPYPHKQQISAIKALQSRSQVVSASLDLTIKLWDVRTKSELATFTGHTDKIIAIVTLDDTHLAASAGKDSRIKVWNLSACSEAASFASHTGGVTCLCPSFSGEMLISGGEDGAVKVWSIGSLGEIGGLEGHSSGVESVVVVEGDEYCLSVAYRTIIVWSLREMCQVRTLVNSHAVTGVGVGGGCLVFSAGDALKAWGMLDAPPTIISKFDEVITSISPLGNDDYILVHLSKGILIWSISESCEIASLIDYTSSAEDHLYYPVLTKDGGKVVYETNMNLQTWSLARKRGRETREMSTAGSSGKVIAAQGEIGHVKVFSYDTQDYATSQGCHSASIEGLLLDPQSKYCLTWSAHDSKLWSLPDLRELATSSLVFEDIKTVVVAPDETVCYLLVLKFGEQGAWLAWRLSDKPEISTVREVSINASLVLTEDGKLCVLRTRNEVVVLTVSTATEVVLTAEDCGVRSVLAVTANSERMLVGMWDAVQVVCLRTMKEERVLKGHKGAVTCVASTPDSTKVVTGSDDNTLKVWDIRTGSELATFVGHRTAIDCVTVTNDGAYFLSVDTASIHIWSFFDLRVVTTIPRAMTLIDSVALTPDHRYCLAWSSSWFNGKFACQVDLFPVTLPRPQTEVCSEQPSDELISNIPHYVLGHHRSVRLAGESFEGWGVNSLHISAYYNQFERCRDYLKAGVPLIRGKFGSPLTLSLSRKTMKCTNAILECFIASATVAKSDSIWTKFESIAEDIPELLKSQSEQLVDFCRAIMQPSAQLPILPQFLCVNDELPIVKFIENRFVDCSLFENKTKNEEIVTFYISVFRWNLTFGSNESIAMLESLLKCKNSRVVLSRYASIIIDEKWKKCKFAIYAIVAMHILLLSIIIAIIFNFLSFEYHKNTIFCLNGAFIIYESMKISALGIQYFEDYWNDVELVRIATCVYWSLNAQNSAYEADYLLLFTLTLLCYISGFGYFRYFSATRILLEICIAYLVEMMSFCIIIALPFFGLSIFPFSTPISQIHLESFTNLEWGLIGLAIAATSFALMSLSMTALGEIYRKAKRMKVESDYLEKVKFIIGCESLPFIRGKCGKSTIIAVCESENQPKTDNIFHRQNNHTTALTNLGLSNRMNEGKIFEFTDKVMGKMDTMEGRVCAIEGKVESLEGKVDGIEGMLKGGLGKIEEIQKNLEAVLAALKEERPGKDRQ